MRHAVRSFIFFFASLVLASASFAASSGVKLDKAELHLLDGGVLADQSYLAAIEMRLASGVKTYWRMPGESGLPPIFDFSASQNIASVEVKWPQPARYEEADGTILGFKERVIFPLLVTPKNPADPVTLAVKLDFGLCDTLCLPANAELSRALSKSGTPDARAEIEPFLARVPKSTTLKGEASPSLLSVTPQGQALQFELASDSALKDLIIEAQGSWFFGPPSIQSVSPGRYQVTIPIEQKPASASLNGLALIVTAIAEGSATETAISLDASGSIR